MQGIAKSMFAAIIVAIVIMMFTNFVFFFPWYMTLIVETFNVAQVVASENYLKKEYEESLLEKMEKRPIYKERADKIKIYAWKEVTGDSDVDKDDAIGEIGVSDYSERTNKPYRQRGEPVTVKISAVYPLTVELWGKEYTRDIPISFSLTTTGLKHYKDLEYYHN